MFARYLVEAPPNVCTPTYLAQAAAHLVAKHPDVLSLKVLEKEECEALGMGCYLGVAQASTEPPKFIHLTYTPPGGADGKKKVRVYAYVCVCECECVCAGDAGAACTICPWLVIVGFLTVLAKLVGVELRIVNKALFRVRGGCWSGLRYLPFCRSASSKDYTTNTQN